MINKKDWARIEAELNAVQKGCCARTYTIEEIYEIAEEVEKEVVKFPGGCTNFLRIKRDKVQKISDLLYVMLNSVGGKAYKKTSNFLCVIL